MKVTSLLLLTVLPGLVLTQGGVNGNGTGQQENERAINPESEEIDEQAFREMFMLTGDEVARMVAEADMIDTDFDTVVDVVPGTRELIAKPKPLQCKNGPVKIIYRRPGYWYFPPIRVTRCQGLNCPNNARCLARTTVIRNVWAICFKRFNCWGLILWIPIGIQRICVEDQRNCDCEKCSDITDYGACVHRDPCPEEEFLPSFCYWKPFNPPNNDKLADLALLDAADFDIETSPVDPCLWGSCDCCRPTPCLQNQFFDRRICACRCRPDIECPGLFEVDPETCMCACPRTRRCGPNRRWNTDTCRCECKERFCFPPRIPTNRCQCECPPIFCFSPFVQNPATCACDCPKNIVCPSNQFLNRDTCECECIRIDCDPGFQQSPDTCLCECETECPPNFKQDPITCDCICDVDSIECEPGFIPDPENCTCVCNQECENGFILDPDTCECICDVTALECLPDFIPDPETCDCVCDVDNIECEPGFVLDPEKCTCICVRECEPGFILDPDICMCICKRECPANFTLDLDLCNCTCNMECPPNFQLDPNQCVCDCIEQECPTGFRFDHENCSCVCDTNQECPPNFSLDSESCSCECRRECPSGTILNSELCVCEEFHNCSQIKSQGICNTSRCPDVLLINNCRWFPSDSNPLGGVCGCECCGKASIAVTLDCGALTPQGRERCISAVDEGIFPACLWWC